MKSMAIKNIPPELAYCLQKKVHGNLRARGPRVHDGRRYFQDLPRKYATRFTLYTGYRYPKDYLKFAGIREDGKLRLTFNQADKQ